MKSRFALRQIRDSRKLIMGFATLWIAFYHSRYLDFSQSETLVRLHLAGTLHFLRIIGNCGVDFFLFVSGFGLFHSLSRDSAVGPFYGRRFRRLLPPVLIVSILTFGFLGCGSLREYCANPFLYGLFLPGCNSWHFWYCSFLLALYLLYPVIHRVLLRFDWKGALAMIALSVLLTLLLRRFAPRYFYQIEICTTRIPIFVLGAWIGKRSGEGGSLPGWLTVPALLLLVGGLLCLKSFPIPSGLSFLKRYCYLPLVLLMIFLLTELDAALHWAWLRRILEFFGEYSLELYLLYENLYRNLGGFFRSSDSVGITYALPCFVTALLLSLALKRAAAVISEGCFGKAAG